MVIYLSISLNFPLRGIEGGSHRIQKTLFHEKQSLIENSLFGVDINPNSVKICRLRLWIELLKHAYYKKPLMIHKSLKPYPILISISKRVIL